MSTHHRETKLTEDGTLSLNALPFRAGETVEVVVVSHSSNAQPTNPYPLIGTSVRYIEPTEAVAEQDWEALR